MSSHDRPRPISREVALRIGLAARQLPDVSLVDLVGALRAQLGEILDESALSRVTVSSLRAALPAGLQPDARERSESSGEADAPDLASFKEAVRILWGEIDAGRGLPPFTPLRDGEMPRSVRVAVASNEGDRLDGHFGSCARFLVYQVSADEIRLVDVRPTVDAELSSDKNTVRVELIRDCRVLYVVSIGGPASAKVIRADIHIVQHREGGDARDVLARLQPVIAGAPPPWLAKALSAPAGGHAPPIAR